MRRVYAPIVACGIAAAAVAVPACSQGPGDAPEQPGQSHELAKLGKLDTDLYVKTNTIWGSASIPVCWESAGNDTQKGWVRNAVETTWEQETAINFSGWGTCNSSTNSGIRIYTGDIWPHTTALGTELNNVANGMQLNFWFTFTATNSDGAVYQPFGSCIGSSLEHCVRAIAVHEFGHALGFAHEQNRGDTPSTCTQAPQGESGNQTYGSWDLGSVMNYCNPAWNNNGLLSATDIAGASQYYGGPRSISTVAWSANRLDSFYRGTDGALWHKWWNGSAWGGPESLGGYLTSDPVAVSWAANRLDIFARGGDGALWHKWWGGSGWGAWESLGGQIIGSPAAVSWGPGRLDIFARGTDNAIWHMWYGGGWGSWESVGGNVTGSLSVVSWAANRLDIFARSADGSLGHQWWNGSSWGTYESLGGQLLSSPTAVSWGPGRLDIFARGLDYALWHIYYSGGWSGWGSVGGQIYGNPAAVSWGPDRIDLFVRGLDDGLWHSYSNGGAFSGWESRGGVFGGTPSAVSWSGNRLDMFVRGMNSSEWHQYWGGSSWGGWEDVGGSLK